ncbi:MAG: hypothetical protein EGP94_15330, partial [Lachnospiraceae bacterium]|nr:hypothetical protein [Lachnospiraceae bacterium]
MKKKVWGVLFLTALALNVLAWKSSSFCDLTFIQKKDGKKRKESFICTTIRLWSRSPEKRNIC